MSGMSGKMILGIGAGAVMLLVIVVRLFSGGTPDVSSGDESRRLTAVHKIAAGNSADAAETLARVVAKDKSPRVRRDALAGLSHILKPVHRDLIRKSSQDVDVGVREIAVDAMGAYAKMYPEDKSVAVELIAIVKKESKEEESVRKRALRSLGKCASPQSIVTLLDRAEHGATNEIKLVAMTSLLSKLGVNISRDRDPKYDRGWRDLIQRWKQSRRIQEAYKAANKRLVSRPQDLMGKDWHPERRRR
jgi:HEAT repeat protein